MYRYSGILHEDNLLYIKEYGGIMIIYKDIFAKLEKAGYSIEKIREEELISESNLQKIMKGEPVNMKTIDTICRLTVCQIGDIITYIPDEQKR